MFGPTLVKLVVFLAQGGTRYLDGIQENEWKEFAEANGLVVKKSIQSMNALFLEIDPLTTDISSFYSYEEAFGTQNECWRTFVFVVSSEDKDVWGVNSFFQETPFAPFLNQLLTV